MDNKQSYLSRFTTQLVNFMNDLRDLIPEERKTLDKLTVVVEMLKKSNPRLLAENWKFFLNPYREKIMADDETFFLEFNNYHHDENVISQILSLKSIWVNDLTKQNKDNIKNYIKVLLYLADRV